MSAATQKKQYLQKTSVSNVTLEMAAVQWRDFNDIDDVDPLNANDYACLSEIREVLKKHNKRDRFGVALLHKHFDVNDNEILMETSDKVNRVLTIKPYERDSGVKGVETIWKLLDGDNLETMTWCQTKCTYGANGHESSEA